MSKLEEFKLLNTRPASILEVGGFRPTKDRFASNVGLHPLASPGQTWPTFEDRPMIFVCQLNLSTAPAVPPLLEDIKLITFFIDSEDGTIDDRENGPPDSLKADWRLFAYSSLEGLVPLTPPAANNPKLTRGFECRWTARDDHPEYDDPDRLVLEGFDDSEVEFESVARSKIGGYPSTLQSEPWWYIEEHPAKPAYCIQIASEEKAGLKFGDAGIVYIARGTAEGSKDRWFLDWQCY